jgi:hypothetical protein
MESQPETSQTPQDDRQAVAMKIQGEYTGRDRRRARAIWAQGFCSTIQELSEITNYPPDLLELWRISDHWDAIVPVSGLWKRSKGQKEDAKGRFMAQISARLGRLLLQCDEIEPQTPKDCVLMAEALMCTARAAQHCGLLDKPNPTTTQTVAIGLQMHSGELSNSPFDFVPQIPNASVTEV